MKTILIYLALSLTLLTACGAPASETNQNEYNKMNVTCYSDGQVVYKAENIPNQSIMWNEGNYWFKTPDGVQHFVPRATCLVEKYH